MSWDLMHWSWPLTQHAVRPGVALRYEQWLVYHYRVLLFPPVATA